MSEVKEFRQERQFIPVVQGDEVEVGNLNCWPYLKDRDSTIGKEFDEEQPPHLLYPTHPIGKEKLMFEATTTGLDQLNSQAILQGLWKIWRKFFSSTNPPSPRQSLCTAIQRKTVKPQQ